MYPRVGLGYDLHRLQPGNGLLLGGVRIAAAITTVAHSDGDVLLHALTDAVLGALGEADLGEVFPDTDPANRNRDSREFLRHALARARAAGSRVGNLDTVIQLERPRLAAHKQKIRASLARLCGVEPARVGVKAKSGEGTGEVGRGEVIVAQAVVMLVPEAGI